MVGINLLIEEEEKQKATLNAVCNHETVDFGNMFIYFMKSFLRKELLVINGLRLFRRQVPKQAKPPILPPSKKVLYNIVNVPWEKKEDEVDMRESAGIGLEALRVKEKEELDHCLMLNEERNEMLRAERKVREEIEMRETKEKILEKIETVLEDEDKNVALRREEVLSLIEQSPDFITKENVDAKLEEALKNPISYDFAIDLEGNRIDDLPRFI